jgi:hypothetical protein
MKNGRGIFALVRLREPYESEAEFFCADLMSKGWHQTMVMLSSIPIVGSLLSKRHQSH